MQYIFLIYGAESAAQEPQDPADFEAYMAPWVEYDALMKESGGMLGGNALQPTATATTVTSKDGKAVFTDGPFAETKEQLGGYYLVDCANLDEALALAAKCPGVHEGRVEVRPIMDLSGFE